jgi:serine/threonine protein kinase
MQGEVKVTDFGIARVMQQASLTASGVLKGKVSYMAPEQTFSSNVDQRADVFAMGVIVWELLCRRRLFQASNDLLVVEKVRKSDIPAPHIVNPAIPEELSDVVMSALARELDARVPDAATFQQQLKPWLWVPTANEELARFMQQLLAGEVSTSEFALFDDFQAPVFGAISATSLPSLPSVQEDTNTPSVTPKRGTAQLAGWSPPTPGEAQDPKEQEADESTDSDSLPSVPDASEEEKVPIAASAHGWMIRTEAMPSASAVVAGMYDGKFGARSEDAHAPDDPSIVSTVQVKPAELLQSFGHLDPLAKTRLDPEDPDDLITEELLKRGYDPAVERSPLPPGAVSNDPTVEVNPALHLGDLSKLVPVVADDVLPTEQENVLAYAPTGSVQKFSADELESMVKEADGAAVAKNAIWRWVGLGVLLLSLFFLLYFVQFR